MCCNICKLRFCILSTGNNEKKYAFGQIVTLKLTSFYLLVLIAHAVLEHRSHNCCEGVMEMITNSDCLLRSSVINSFIYFCVSVGMLIPVSSNYVPVRLAPTSRNEVLACLCVHTIQGLY